jgi:PAS domain S-box-containing protein
VIGTIENRVFFFQLDLSAGGAVASFDRDFYEILYTNEDVKESVTLSWYDIVHPDDAEQLQRLHQNLSVSNHYLEAEYQLRMKDGGYVLVTEKSSFQRSFTTGKDLLLGSVCVHWDQSAVLFTKKASQLIQIAQKSGKVGSYHYTVSDQKIFWSSALKRIHGLEREPKLEDYWNLLHPDDRDRHVTLFHRSMKEGQGYQAVYRVVRKNDAKVVYVFTTVDPIFDETGTLNAVSGITVDINQLFTLLKKSSDLLDEHAVDGEDVKPRKVLFLRIDGVLRSIIVAEILAVVAMKDYIQVYTEGCKKPYVIYKTLKEMFAALPRDMFVQIHRSYIVNVSRIERVDGHKVTIADLQYPIGKSYRTAFIAAIEQGL